MVIAGDVFHNKGRLETEGATVFFRWINQILEIMPILVICGNHDFRQEDPSYCDMIEMFTTPYSAPGRHPIHYLRDTGLYRWGNVGFGVVSVKDTLRAFNTRGMVDDLPPFPLFPTAADGGGPELVRRVAIFHGSISQSALPNGRLMPTDHGYPLEWFRGYDIAMLGDNHKQQLHKDALDGTLQWGYPGSLIQQDIGEPTFGHGFILWNLAKNRGKLFHVPNDYGSFTMRQDGAGGWRVRFGLRDTQPLEKAIARDGFPLRPNVRVLGGRGDEIYAKEALGKYGVEPSSLRLTHPGPEEIYSNNNTPEYEDGEEGQDGGAEDDKGDGDAGAMGRLVDLNTPERWDSYIRLVAPGLDGATEWIHTPGRMLLPVDRYALPPEFCQKMATRNAGIQKALDQYEAEASGSRAQHGRPRGSIYLKRMRWDYLMCYGKDNWFDFEAMDGKVGLLNGRNASGKSSFLDIVCIALYGQPTKSRREFSGTKMTSKIIHDKKPDGNAESASVQLLFQADGRYYEIRRNVCPQSQSAKVRTSVATIYSVSRADDGSYERTGVVADGTTVVDKWVEGVFGDIREILMSTIMCQSDKDNFFFQKDDEQKVLLERALCMGTISAFESVLDEVFKAYRYMLNEVGTYVKGVSDSREGQHIEGAEEKVRELRARVSALESGYSRDMARANGLLQTVGMVREVEAHPWAQHDEDALAREYSRVSSALDYSIDRGAKDGLLLEIGRMRSKLEDLGSTSGPSLEEARAVLAREENQGWVPGSGPSRQDVIARSKEHARWLERAPKDAAKITAKRMQRLGADIQAAQEGLRDLLGFAVPAPSLPRPKDGENGDAIAVVGRDGLDALYDRYMVLVAEREGLPPDCGRTLDEVRAVLARAEKGLAGADGDAEDLGSAVAMIARALGSRDVPTSWSAAVPAGAPGEDASSEALVAFLSGQEDMLQGLLGQEVHAGRPKEGLPRWQKELAAWRSLVDGVDPEGSSAEMRSRIAEIEAYLAGVEKIRDQVEVLRERSAELSAEIADIEKAPFNPDCWACCEQPMAIRKAALAKELAGVSERLRKQERAHKKIDWDGTVMEMRDELVELRALVPRQEQYEGRREQMEAEIAEWEAAARAWEGMEQRTARISAARDAIAYSRWVLSTRHKRLSARLELIAERDRASRDMASILALAKWRKAMAGVHWSLWESLRKIRGDLEASLAEMTARHAAWSRYMFEEAEWADTMAAVQLEAERWAAHDVVERDRLSGEIAAHEAVLAGIVEQEGLERDLAMIERIRAYQEWRGLSEAMASVGQELDRARVRLVSVEKVWEEQKLWSDKIAGYMAALTDIRDRFHLISGLRSAFIGGEKGHGGSGAGPAGFKSWVYEKEVVPLIESGVNRFLEDLDDFRLRIEYVDGRFLYLVEDRGNRPTLDHCSGYQKFLVGMGMRAALAQIGAVGQNVRNLFLDEAFVACDAENIQKVSDILRGMMATGGYRSVLLMSHLDTIRENTALCIDIERARGSPFSTIRWGEPYQVLGRIGTSSRVVVDRAEGPTQDGVVVAAAAPKRRGRPPKAAAAGG